MENTDSDSEMENTDLDSEKEMESTDLDIEMENIDKEKEMENTIVDLDLERKSIEIVKESSILILMENLNSVDYLLWNNISENGLENSDKKEKTLTKTVKNSLLEKFSDTGSKLSKMSYQTSKTNQPKEKNKTKEKVKEKDKENLQMIIMI